MSKVNWNQVASSLKGFASDERNELLLDESQRASLAELAQRIEAGKKMVLIADEVGMGKTRIAAALIAAVRKAGGRAAVVLPPGLGAQWQSEIQLFSGGEKPLLPLRSYEGFIAGFVQDQDKKTTKQKLMDRRSQRELPSKSWADETVLMVSHNFATMQFPQIEREKAHWRRLLLSKVRTFCGRANLEKRITNKNNEMDWRAIGSYRAAECIASKITEQLAAEIKFNNSRFYSQLSADEYKKELLPLIGVALGQFDLVVIDEAHKYRGEDSSLSKILGQMLVTKDDAFRMGMTATPVELDAEQWINTIERINGSNDASLDNLKGPINDYVDVVRRIQIEVLDESLVTDFEAKARAFETALRPYVLRRDKRDDPIFEKYIQTYRRVEICRVDPRATQTTDVSREWLRRMAAAEALSLLPDSSLQEKRQRIQLAQGLGLVGHSTEADEDQLQKSSECPDQQESNRTSFNGPSDFWIEAAMSRKTEEIYTHPSILEAVRLIESYALKGEKVLVFGVFIKPLQALARLLDARAILRTLEEGGEWPSSTIDEDAVDAIDAALNMHDKPKSIASRQVVEDWLKNQSSERERKRQSELVKLKNGLREKASSGDSRAIFLMGMWPNNQLSMVTEAMKFKTRNLFIALDEIRASSSDEAWCVDELLKKFEELTKELLGATADEPENTEKSDDKGFDWSDEKFGKKFQGQIGEYLENYSGSDGSFARLMHGKTKPQTRRNMQASFNRSNSRLRVLLAQSQVGREGLNLQESCRTIVLLHSEWNPAVVEQQIGRVDRKKSQWLRDVAKWENYGCIGDMPTINIHPIVFAGTYGEHNWNTLESRWRSLRAQLHGNVLGDASSTLDEHQCDLRRRIKNATPRFSPLSKKESACI
jgi:SNF2 family DNA or RNA helicase